MTASGSLEHNSVQEETRSQSYVARERQKSRKSTVLSFRSDKSKAQKIPCRDLWSDTLWSKRGWQQHHKSKALNSKMKCSKKSRETTKPSKFSREIGTTSWAYSNFSLTLSSSGNTWKKLDSFNTLAFERLSTWQCCWNIACTQHTHW